MATLGAFVTNS